MITNKEWFYKYTKNKTFYTICFDNIEIDNYSWYKNESSEVIKYLKETKPSFSEI